MPFCPSHQPRSSAMPHAIILSLNVIPQCTLSSISSLNIDQKVARLYQINQTLYTFERRESRREPTLFSVNVTFSLPHPPSSASFIFVFTSSSSSSASSTASRTIVPSTSDLFRHLSLPTWRLASSECELKSVTNGVPGPSNRPVQAFLPVPNPFPSLAKGPTRIL